MESAKYYYFIWLDVNHEFSTSAIVEFSVNLILDEL